MNVECFAVKHRELLELEKNAEIEETQSLHKEVPSKHLEKLGLCIRKLQVFEKRSGLYGRTLVKFQPQWAGKELPSHKIFSGDIVGVGLSNDFGHRDVIMSGVVWGVSTVTVTVAFEENVDAFSLDNNAFYCLIKLANNVTYRRLKNILLDLQKYKGGGASHLIEVLFGGCSPSSPLVSLPTSICTDSGAIKFRNNSLNDTQKAAVKFALCQREIAIIHGPPGTGKTTTLVEIIYQITKQGLKCLVCAPSNVAVDNLVERLFANGAKVVRLGHPARAMQINQDLSLDAALFACDNAELVGDIRKEMDVILAKLGKTKDKNMRYRLQKESKELSQELRRREKAAITEILLRADVVASTLTSCYSDGPIKHLPKDHFDYVIIDECSQAVEAACWVPLLRSSRCVIAGDHLQLPPTIISKAAAKKGLAITLMERLLGFSGSDAFVRMLETQYRMHCSIMQWPSDKLYGGRLNAHPTVAAHLLRDLPNVADNENTGTALLLIDTTGCDMPELEIEDEASKGNEGEAKLVCRHVECLVESGVAAADIAVITPYNLQVHILRGMLSGRHPDLEIKSVDGFQGREKEAVVMSLVRSNERREVGFLAEDRRINVAVTRARRHLAVVCDSETVSQHQFLKEFVDYMNEHGEVRSAQQYGDQLAEYATTPMDGIKTRQHLPGGSATTSTSKPKKQPKIKSDKKNCVKIHDASASAQPQTKTTFGSTNAESVKSNEDTDEARQRFTEVLLKFVSNKRASEHRFPTNLSPLDRKIVHEICEHLGLDHASHGDKDGRHIMVTKVVSADKSLKKTAKKDDGGVPKSTSSTTQPAGNTRQNVLQSDSKKIVETKVCVEAVKSKPAPEQTDHNPAPVVQQANKDCPPQNGGVAKPKKNKKEKSSKPPEEIEDDDVMLDRLLRETVKRDNTCHYPRCKNSTVLIRQTCDFCRQGFCLSHSIPEVHGCGDAARAEARARIAKEKSLVPGSGKVSRKTDPADRARLERKMGRKLDELAGQRAPKPSKKDK